MRRSGRSWRGQQLSKPPIIGVLLTGNPDPEVFLKWFREALRQVGNIESQNITNSTFVARRPREWTDAEDATEKVTMEKKTFDRTAEDLGNIVNLGHVNLNITDQRIATHFYITGLGLTRDPYLNTGVRIMWVNVGMSQFHLPTGDPANVLRGTVGLVIPDHPALLDRLKSVSQHLKDTRFAFRESNDGIETICPWGNRIRVHAPDRSRFGRMALGMAYLAFDVPPGTADGLAQFYREVMGAAVAVEPNSAGRKARIQVGDKQFYYFVETEEPQSPYDGHHAQIYVCDFSGPYRRLVELGLLTVEFGQHEYRFNDIIDLETRRPLFTVEHEVRSQKHPLFARPLVNRNPAQDNRNYKPGHDSMSWSLP